MGSRRTSSTLRMTRRQTERAWLAGVIESDGTIYSKKRGKYATPCVRIHMTDKDVLDTVVAITGFARVLGPYERTVKRFDTEKPYYVWQVHGKDALRVYQAIRPWLHSRRLAQAGRSFGD